MKLISQGPSLTEFAQFGIILLDSGAKISTDLKISLLGMILRQILIGQYSASFEKLFNEISNISFFDGISKALVNELTYHPSLSQQKCQNSVKRIVSLVKKSQKPKMAAELLEASTVTPLTSSDWRKLVYHCLPDVEPYLITNLEKSLNLSEKTEISLMQQIGNLSSVSQPFLAKTVKNLSDSVFACPDWGNISADDIEIALTPEGELWDTSVVTKKEKQLDKNSKNYEEEKWALELKKKQEAKDRKKIN